MDKNTILFMARQAGIQQPENHAGWIDVCLGAVAAEREPRNRRGWQAQYQTRCDCCGRFTQPGAPGSSWVMVPHSDVSMGDERERCPACTEKRGPAECGPQYVKHLCCGVVPNV